MEFLVLDLFWCDFLWCWFDLCFGLGLVRFGFVRFSSGIGFVFGLGLVMWFWRGLVRFGLVLFFLLNSCVWVVYICCVSVVV